MELIENVGWVSKDKEEYPTWFQQWLKDKENENERRRSKEGKETY